MFRHGKTPARAGAMKLALASYVDHSKLPPIPANFGHDDLIGANDWGMLGNDKWGCCVWAGGCHEHMLWNRVSQHQVTFTEANVLSAYSAVTGFDPSKTDSAGNNPTDRGTDMVLAAEYRRTNGLVDASGQTHRIEAYLALDPGSLDDLWAATYLFGAVGIGIDMPETAETQFDAGQEWVYVHGAQSIGGHYVPLVGRKDGVLHVLTYGRTQPTSLKFLQKYCDEAIAYLSKDALVNNKSPEGFDLDSLVADLHSLHKAA